MRVLTHVSLRNRRENTTWYNASRITVRFVVRETPISLSSIAMAIYTMCDSTFIHTTIYIWYINFTFVDRIYWIWIGFPNFIHIDCGTVSQIRHPLMVSKIDYVIVLLVVDRSPLSVWAIHSDIQFIDGLDSGGMMVMMRWCRKEILLAVIDDGYDERKSPKLANNALLITLFSQSLCRHNGGRLWPMFAW